MFRLFANRAKEYIAWVNFLIIAYTSTVLTDLQLIHFVIGLPLFLLFLLFDWVVVFPSFQRAVTDKHPYFRDVKKQLDRIELLLLEKEVKK